MYKENIMCECIQVQGVLKPSKGCKECFPNKPHVHAELIKAWADGAEVEIYDRFNKCPSWINVKDYFKTMASPVWYDDMEYRIKPTPKPDIHTFAYVYRINNASAFRFTKQEDANVKFVFDGDTEELKEVIVL
jgi:hypothetical protein